MPERHAGAEREGRDRTVSVDGRSLFLKEWGDPDAPPALLIHGIPTNGLLWSDVAPRLASAARVVAIDLLGYGRSDPPDGRPVDIVAQSEYVVRALDTLGIRSATVVGHDIGGGVAQILATRHPARVDRLGLVNSVCYDSWPIPEMKAIQGTSPLVERLPARLTMAGIERGLRRGFVHRERAELFLERFLEPFATPEGLDVFVEHARALDSKPTRDLAPLLPELAIPVAVVWGRHDPFQKPEYARRLASDIPGATLTWIEEASHFAPADAPEPVAGALLQLLSRD